MPTLAGTVMGPFRLCEEVGSGGMGTVFRAEAIQPVAGLRPGDRAAVKVIHPHLVTSGSLLERFLREAAAGVRILHPNVVRTLASGTGNSDGVELPWIALEFLEGVTLFSLLREVGRLPDELCRRLGADIASGLSSIHAAGVVHRDLKPENVIITPDEVVKITDLGVARIRDEQVRLSVTGQFIGTFQYAAPEQFHIELVDGRADLYALGWLLYTLSSGRHPLDGNSQAMVIQSQLHEIPRPLSHAAPGTSPFLDAVVETLLQKDPDRRFRSAAEVEEILRQGESSEWWHSRSPALPTELLQMPGHRRLDVPRRTAMHGRTAELAFLRDTFHEASAGRGRCILVEGAPGYGKTRLLDETVSRLAVDHRDFHLLLGVFPAAAGPNGFTSVAASLLAHLCGVDGEDRLRRHLAGAPWLAPAVASFLRGGDTQGAIQPPGLDSLRTAVVLSARACADERATLVILEDLQNGGLEGAELLADLAVAVSGSRLMVIGTTSAALPPRALARLERSPGFDRLNLQPLGTDSVNALLADALGSTVPGGLSVEIAAAGSGSPLFALEILRDLQESGDLVRGADGRWTRRNEAGPLPLPASVKGMVEARLADLDEDDRDLLDVAACCGVEFDPVRAGAVLGRGPIPTLRRLARLEERHRLVRAAGDHCFFESPRVREVILDRLSSPLRLQYEAALERGAPLHPTRPVSPTQPEDDGQERPFRVLVADDDEIVRGLLVSHVEALGLHAIPADNGISALAQMRRDAPDLLLLDMKMPGLSGNEVLQRVKGDPRLREIPVIVITGVDDVAAAAECLKVGAVDYIVKPFNSTLLRARIGSTVDRGLLRRREQDYQRRIEEYSLSLEERMGTATREAEAALRLWGRTQRARSMMLRLIAEDVGGKEADRSPERVLLLIEDALALTRWTEGEGPPPTLPTPLGKILADASPRLPKPMHRRIPDATEFAAVDIPSDPILAPLTFAALIETVLSIGGDGSPPRLTVTVSSSGATVEFLLPGVRPDPHRLQQLNLQLTPQDRGDARLGDIAPALAARLLDLRGGRVSAHDSDAGLLLQAHFPSRTL